MDGLILIKKCLLKLVRVLLRISKCILRDKLKTDNSKKEEKVDTEVDKQISEVLRIAR